MRDAARIGARDSTRDSLRESRPPAAPPVTSGPIVGRCPGGVWPLLAQAPPALGPSAGRLERHGWASGT